MNQHEDRKIALFEEGRLTGVSVRWIVFCIVDFAFLVMLAVVSALLLPEYLSVITHCVSAIICVWMITVRMELF